ncbi:MAG: glycosyltransferase [Cyanobacteria bacterium P01_D01_bin.156]
MKDFSIAILVWGLKGGAIANNAIALAKGLHDIGIGKIYLAFLVAQPSESIVIPEGVEVVSLQAKRARWAAFPIAKFINQYQPTVLISLSMFVNMPAAMGWLLSRKGKGQTKLIVSQHSTMSYKAYIEQKNSFVRFYPWLARVLYPMADGVRANSPEVLDDLLNVIKIRSAKEYSVSITNSIDLDSIIGKSKQASEHPWLKEKQGPVIVSAARLAKQKNFPLLLKAFSIVRQTENAKLIIFGKGPEKDNLQAIIRQLNLEDSVDLAGFSANPWCNISKADVFALTSEEEPFGLVLVEALACGTPVLATDAIGGGPKNILDSGKSGVLISSKDPEEIASSLVKLLKSQGYREELSYAGKKRSEDFRPNIIAEQWKSFLDKVLQQV